MTKLTYPKLPKVRLGLWTLKAKIHYYTGLAFEDIHIWCNSDELHIDFQIDLTQEQIDWIGALIQRSDVQGPDGTLIVQNNTYVMWDIWECRERIAAQCGFDFRIWWDTSGEIPGVYDKIIWTPVGPGGSQLILTNVQKKNLVEAITERDGWE
jgi:hypothetical protein